MSSMTGSVVSDVERRGRCFCSSICCHLLRASHAYWQLPAALGPGAHCDTAKGMKMCPIYSYLSPHVVTQGRAAQVQSYTGLCHAAIWIQFPAPRVAQLKKKQLSHSVATVTSTEEVIEAVKPTECFMKPVSRITYEDEIFSNTLLI